MEGLKWISWVVLILGLGACATDGSAGKESQPATGTIDAASTFRFSTLPTADAPRSENNWCTRRFPEAIVVNAPPDNLNRRYFDLENGVHKIVINKGKVTCSMMVRYADSGALELCTSDNFPQCLSGKANYSLLEEASRLHYDNHLNITFDAWVQPNGGLRRMTLEFPVGYDFGLAVHRCQDCQ